jgi:adenylosuccinate synthase
LPGWSQSTLGVTSLDALPATARTYLKTIEDLGGVPIDLISTGPDRNQTLVLRHPFVA